ncbi:MAG: hypothetical protein NZM10_03185 [Fimbriimonadales bacterium]|nr:hypothetical protein [Fimbriimonadales bacterium]
MAMLGVGGELVDGGVQYAWKERLQRASLAQVGVGWQASGGVGGSVGWGGGASVGAGTGGRVAVGEVAGVFARVEP